MNSTTATLTQSDLSCIEWLAKHGDASQLRRLQLLTAARMPPPPMVPHRPTRRQQIFLGLSHIKEVLFGGAAGGGKTDALLMAPAAYFGHPQFAGLILRRTLKNARLPGSILDRAHSWWRSCAHFSSETNRFTFPSGATLTFGHLEHENTKYDYNSTEFNYIGFDELTEFTETQYSYLTSRLRRPAGSDIPSLIRAGTNPGGTGHAWVKRRFISDAALRESTTADYRRIFEHEGRAYVPSKLDDNPHLDREEYKQTLRNLDPVTRARLLAGDWQAAEDGLCDASWPQYFRQVNHEYLLLNREGEIVAHFPQAECRRFAVIDCAATAKELTKAHKLARAAQSVISTFDFWPDAPPGRWLLIDCRRGQWGYPELRRQTVEAFEELRPNWVGIEDEKTGRALWQDLYNDLPVIPLSPSSLDKVTRASPLLNALHKHRVYFPESAWWLEELLDELLFWHGLDDEPADHIDTLAYAVREVETLAASPASGASGPFLAGGL